MAIPGFEAFFAGWQLDLRLAVVPPILCAILDLSLSIWMGQRKYQSGKNLSYLHASAMVSGGAWILIPDFIC